LGSGQDVTVSRTVQVDVDKAVAFSGSGDLEWVDPFVGFRIRHVRETIFEKVQVLREKCHVKILGPVL
jgi:hypothetical protein